MTHLLSNYVGHQSNMFSRARFTLLFFILGLFSPLSLAVMIEAEGRAPLNNNDYVSARENAVRDATRQASMQAAVYVSGNQQIRDGILEIDNMQISTLGKVSQVEIIDQRVEGQYLLVRIRADVQFDTGCENGSTNNYMKSVAITAFPITQSAQAMLGGLDNAVSALPAQLAQHLSNSGRVNIFKATHLNLYDSLDSAASRQLDDGALSTVAANTRQLAVQYIISGVIRDMSMIDQEALQDQNYFRDLLRRIDSRGPHYRRNFMLDIYLHDAYSGTLLSEKRYQASGLWQLEPELRVGFGSSAFGQQEYGRNINQLLATLSEEMAQDLRCRPYSALISRTEGKEVWLDAGQNSGLKRGDKLTVFHRSTFFNGALQPKTHLTNTRKTLVIDEVQAQTTRAYLMTDSHQSNILPGDLAIAR
ncbi:flagellar assembly protein T N-terminal domain-containing protein [Marinobacterium jannaschii]|uniref:flagellar assembly protein T N-terminal domain-containing protein n=1 Tax=Marinobacterium jannaschii TaxID=64970 RepID=UPI00048951B9|nr:flagellar assembly protein T N-terminal domain-containing protein [Marinobacterium jannaschii]